MATNKHSTQLIFDAIIKDGGFQTTIKRMSGSVNMLEKAVGRFQNTLLGAFSAYAVIGAIQNTIRTIADFDKTMTAVSVITGATGRDFDRLEKSALSLGSSTQYTAKQVAELQLEFGRLGFSTREILQSTNAVVNLATATGEGLARSAEIAGSTLRAFNLDASQMGKVTDIMAAALNNSALTLDSFADGIKYVAPVAAATNVSLAETASMMSVLADAGIKGSQAGTSLRRIFTMLTDEGKPLQQRLDELSKSGITLAQANDEVGLYAQTALIVLTKYKTRIDELNIAYENAVGSTDAMARAMENNLGTAITKVGTAWDALILSFSNSKGILSAMAEQTSDLLRLMASDKLGFFEKLAAIGTAGSNPVALNLAISKMNLLNAAAEEADKKLDELIESQANRAIEEFSGNIKAIGEAYKSNVNFAQIYARVIDILKQKEIDGAKALVDSTNKKIEATKEENKAYQDQIKLINERYAAIQKGESIQRSVAEFKAEAPARSSALRNAFKLGAPEQLLPPPPPDVEVLTLWDKAIKQQETYAETVKAARIAMMEGANEEKAMLEAREASWAQSIESIGDSIGRAIQANESLGRSVAAVGASIIEELEKQAIAALIRNSLLKGVNLAAAIAGIAVGMSVIKGLFAKISKNSNGDSSARVSQGYVNTRSDSSVSFRIRGEDLVGTISNYNKNGRYTYAGG